MDTIPPSAKRINPFNIFKGAFVPNWIFSREELSPGAKLCYGALCWYTGRNGHCWPSQKALGKRMGVSVRQVRRYLLELTERSLIEVKQRGLTRTSLYYFLDHPWITEESHAEEDEQEPTIGGIPDRTDLSGQEGTDPAYGRESREESQSSLRSDDNKSPSARNLNSSGEKMRTWEGFLSQLDDSRFTSGVLSPVDNPEPYARKAARSGSSPPIDIDLVLLKQTALTVKHGMRLETVRLPRIEDIQETATWFGKLHEHLGSDNFFRWLEWAASRVSTRKGSLADDRLLLHSLTQVGVLAPFSVWQESRAVTPPVGTAG